MPHVEQVLMRIAEAAERAQLVAEFTALAQAKYGKAASTQPMKDRYHELQKMLWPWPPERTP